MITFAESPLFSGLVESDRYFERVDMAGIAYGLHAPSRFRPGGVVPAFADEERKVYGLQFYAETNDPDGLRILSNFARGVCGCDPWWTMEAFLETFEGKMREEFQSGIALLAISGGVDSSVCAAIMHRAIGERLKCVFVDTGLMRLGRDGNRQKGLSGRIGGLISSSWTRLSGSSGAFRA